jgi:hypothetical protein
MKARPSRRLLIVVLVTAIAAIAARIAAPAPERHVRITAAMACGVERWSVKTLKDRPRLLRARKTTVAHLVSLPRPSPFPPPGRLEVERQIYSVVAAVVLDRSEADFDFHLVLRQGSRTMIAESLSSLCTKGATSYRRKQMAGACKVARVCTKARVVGVAFFDFNHGQTGVAPNAIELHPVLGFACLA